jgi:uncharacterized protein (UPF0210 family)
MRASVDRQPYVAAALVCAAALACTVVLARTAVTTTAAVERAAEPAAKPKIRAVTAFIRLDRARYKEQVQNTLEFLHQAKSAFEKKGYEVETIRITTQPFPLYTKDLSADAAVAFLREYDALAVHDGFDAAIGPAMESDADDAREADVLARVIAGTKTLDGSVVIGGEDGIHWKSIRAAARVIRYLEANTAHSQGNFNFTASAMVPSGTPFYPASYFTGQGKQFALALESANVLAAALGSAHTADQAENALKNSLGAHAQQIERIGQALGKETGWEYGGIDLSPAPLKTISIGGAVEGYLHGPIGSSGTVTVAALITRALRAIPVKHAGYSGLMLPILEDSVLAERWGEGHLSMDALLAYSAVCGTGLDTIPLPGNISQEQIERILSDVASLSVKWHKPLAARLLPVEGKKPGEMTEFSDPFLVNTKIQPLP